MNWEAIRNKRLVSMELKGQRQITAITLTFEDGSTMEIESWSNGEINELAIDITPADRRKLFT